MKINFYPTLSFSLLLISSTGANAADIAKGKQLVQGNCVKCHANIVGGDGSKIYTRAGRKIDSLAALNKQVRRCKTGIGISWPKDQIADVVAYLNKTYYKFKK